MISISVVNVGIMVAEKIHLQDSADAAAYSAAVVEARYMNLTAYMNRALIANYNAMAFNTAVWAVVDSNDKGTAIITDLLYKVSFILFFIPITTALATPVDQVADILRDIVHSPLHTLNHHLMNLFGQHDDAQDLNQYIEIFNTDVISTYAGLLYAAQQSARHSIQKEVAERMDPEISTTTLIGLGAEAISYDELARAVDWAIRDPDSRSTPFDILNDSFNRMHGVEADTSQQELLLSATTEASLDKFVAGRTREGELDLLRSFNVGNIIPGTGAIEFALDGLCYAGCAATLGLSGCNCNAEVDLQLGSALRDAQENKANEDHVPFIARRRMREVQLFGIDLDIRDTPGAGVLNAILGQQGYTSGHWKNDVANFANASPNLNHGVDLERAGQCIAAGCFPYTSGLNSINDTLASLMLPTGTQSPLFIDDHWDGAFDGNEPVNSWEIIPPGEGYVETIEYLANLIAEGFYDGVPKYDWRVDIDNVGFGHYHYPADGAERRSVDTTRLTDQNIITGPSVAVVAVKESEDINGLRGLGLGPSAADGNDYDMTAISRAQVYYLANPNRPEEKPSLFNPHWAARLAPIDADDAPALLREGLGFIGSIGIPIDLTH